MATPFTKQPFTYAAKLAQLQTRGLVIADIAAAEHRLRHHNYYRVAAYRFPLELPGVKDQFRPGTRFEDLWGLYAFDQSFRDLVWEATSVVETSLRARWAYELAHRYGSHAYTMPSVFSDTKTLRENLQKLDSELARSKEKFVAHFETNHDMLRPPIWAVTEVMSFGTLSKFYSSLKEARDRQAIADTYDFDESVFTSFLNHITIVRNIAAHHGRLWNREFAVKIGPPRIRPASLISSILPVPRVSPANPKPQAPNHVYNGMVILAHLADLIQPEIRWRHRLRDLIQAQSFPVASHMGFPASWLSLPIWQP